MAKGFRSESLFEFLRALRQDVCHLVAPVVQDGVRLFCEVERVEEISLAEGNTRWSFKEVLFPRFEPLFHYRLSGGSVALQEPEILEGDTVVFGARPCDAASLAVLDAVFAPPSRPGADRDHEDPFYRRRRDRTTIIGLSCTEPGPACFCTAVGLSPTSSAGSDLLLTPVPARQPGQEVLIAEAVTPRGEALLETYARFLVDVPDTKAEVTRAAEERIARNRPTVLGQGAGQEGGSLPTGSLGGPLPALFEGPRWEAIAERCLGCGACAFVCPTCHCFDIVDEGDARGGSRCKFWDSCGFALFTLHTSGHNPRATQPARFRQRVLHKFRYIPERFGVRGCVGCGRCVATCPVNMDIYEVVSSLTE